MRLAIAHDGRVNALARRDDAFPPATIGQSEGAVALHGAAVGLDGAAVPPRGMQVGVERRSNLFREARGGSLRQRNVQLGPCIVLGSQTIVHPSRC